MLPATLYTFLPTRTHYTATELQQAVPSENGVNQKMISLEQLQLSITNTEQEESHQGYNSITGYDLYGLKVMKNEKKSNFSHLRNC